MKGRNYLLVRLDFLVHFDSQYLQSVNRLISRQLHDFNRYPRSSKLGGAMGTNGLAFAWYFEQGLTKLTGNPVISANDLETTAHAATRGKVHGRNWIIEPYGILVQDKKNKSYFRLIKIGVTRISPLY